MAGGKAGKSAAGKAKGKKRCLEETSLKDLHGAYHYVKTLEEVSEIKKLYVGTMANAATMTSLLGSATFKDMQTLYGEDLLAGAT
eukprot:1631093-Amphidinium_carterae.1